MKNPFLLGALISIFAAVEPLVADDTKKDKPTAANQELLTFEVTIKAADGNVVEGANVKPWAIRSSLGHGLWAKKGTGHEPETVTTDAEGKATIKYPKYRNVEEQVKSTNITLSINHLDHPYVSHEDVAVPCETYEAKLPSGTAIEVELIQEGTRITNENIRVICTGGRPLTKESDLRPSEDKTYRIPPLADGPAQIMFLQLDGNQVSHFSQTLNFEIDSSVDVIKKKVELEPAVQVKGQLSENVPRPIRNGRIKVNSISPGKSWDEIQWFDWTEINSDGSFAINWPANTPIQLIALCDGFIATSGKKPEMVPQSRAGGGYHRPQVFMTPALKSLTVDMTPLVACSFEVENGFGKKLEGVEATAYPNVGW